MTIGKNNLRVDRLLLMSLAFIVIGRAVFIVFPSFPFWGINILQFLPAEYAVAISALCAVALVWALMSDDRPEEPKAPKVDIFSRRSLLVITLCAGVLFFFCSIPVALLGDGAQFIVDLYRFVVLKQPVPFYREPLTMLLNAYVFQFINWFAGTKSIIVTYQITGAIFGMLFVATSLKIASNFRMSYSLRVLAFVLFLSCGGTLFFFGYVENYAPQYALVLVYIAFVLHMFRKGGSVWLPGALLVVCCLFHAQNVMLIPSFAVAAGLRTATERGSGKQFAVRVYQGAALAVPLLLLVYAYFQWKPIAPLASPGNPFIPFSPVGGMSYTLLSPMHLVDILWEHLLLAPVAIALLAVLILTNHKHIQWTSPEIVFVAIAAYGVEAFLVGGHFTNGLSRDWDVVATLGTMLTIATLLLLEQVSITVSLRRRVTMATCIVALAGTVSWVAVNVDEHAAIERFTTLLVYNRPAVKPTVTRYGYENLRKFYYQNHDWKNAMAMGDSMLHVTPWHLDLSIFLGVAVGHASELGPAAGESVARELKYLIQNLNDSILSSEVAGDDGEVRIASSGQFPLSLADLIVSGGVQMHELLHMWSFEESMAFGDSAIKLHPTLPLGYELKGWLESATKDTLSAIRFFRAAVNCDERRTHPLLQLALCYNTAQTFDSVRAMCNRALRCDPGSNDAIEIMYSSMPRAALTQNDTADLARMVQASRVCLASAKERKMTAEQIGTIKSIGGKATAMLNKLRATRLP